MYNDKEYRYFMDGNKLMRFSLENEDFWENPRDDFEHFTKMYMSSREYNCTDSDLQDIKSNEDAIRMMIRDADIDVVSAVIEGKISRMEIKYDDECECYDLYVDDGPEASNDCYEWLEDDIIECLTIDDLKNISDNLFVIALDFGYQGCINEVYNADRFDPDGFIWTTANDMIEEGFKDMTSDELSKRAYEILEDEIKDENLWSIGDVFEYVIEECTDIINRDDDFSWDEYDSCGGFFVDSYNAYDEIYDDVIGKNTPYHDDLDDLYSWPDFKISFEDYFNALSQAETSEEIDNIREELKDKIDFSVKTIAAYEDEIVEKIDSLKSFMNTIIGTIANIMSKSTIEDIRTSFDGASVQYHKAYDECTDLEYRLIELKAIA